MGHTDGDTAGRFVGQSIRRVEDPRLLTGRGSYVDDVMLPGMLHAAFVRSPIARARIAGVDIAAATRSPGVHAVLRNDDLEPLLHGPMVPSLYLGAPGPTRRPLAHDAVRYVGEPIVVVIAESRGAAEDAAELVVVDLEPLPPVIGIDAALTSSELVHPDEGTNVAASAAVADPAVEQILRDAPHVVTETFVQQRQTNVPMETRGIVVQWDPHTRNLVVWVSSQNPHEVHRCCARMLGLPEHAVRVLQSDVGGGFGQKFLLGREEMVVVLAASTISRPVKWIEDRHENLVASSHARADRLTCTVALDDDGTILAMSLDHAEDVGAVPVGGAGGAGTAVVTRFSGPYRVPHLAYRTQSLWTNTCARGAYRGPWMMETFAREQMIEHVARVVGMDPIELRRRNAITAEDQPYHAPGGMVIDRVSVPETLEQAAALIGYDDFREEQARARAQGRHLGVGFSLYVEPQGSFAALRLEATTMRVRTDGSVVVYLGSGSHGQGIETTMAQVAADQLGVPFDSVQVVQGDTAATPFGAGTGGSRTAPFLASAVGAASRALRTRVAEIAAHVLEAAADDIEIHDGTVLVRGTPARGITLGELAARLYSGSTRLPPEVDPSLEVTARFDAGGVVFSNACHACTCEVDVHTGIVTILRYVVSEDCGRMINPMIVEGQVAGGIAQGIGGALLEHVVYDEAGTPLTATFLDYLVPLASTMPRVELGHVETPGATPGGHKGMGEGGAIGSPACVANAVADALVPFGIGPAQMPLSPSALVDLLSG